MKQSVKSDYGQEYKGIFSLKLEDGTVINQQDDEDIY